MRAFALIRLAGTVFCSILASHQVFAAPAEQVSCIYDTVLKERLPDFGESALVPEDQQKPDLDPLYNTAENACISQYGWSETDAENAGQYFFGRVAREYLGALFTENRLDPGKIDRAFAAVRTQILQKEGGLDKDRQMIIAALQQQAFPVDNKEVLDFAFMYMGYRFVEDQALADFISGQNRLE